MITLTATIQLGKNNIGEIDTASVDIKKNNISSLITSVLDIKAKGSNPFILGASKLEGNATFEQEVPYYIGSEVADENGNFANEYTIIVSGKDIMGLSIVFDDYNNQYAPTINVDGQNYSNNSSNFIVALTTNDTHTIVIKNWNKANYPLRIQGIFASLTLKIDNKNLIAINSQLMTRSEIDIPSWGIISNTGNIEFSDFQNYVQEYIEKDLLKQNLSCIIYLNNTSSGLSQQVSHKYTDKWNYDNDNKVVNVTIKDDLEEWQEILIDGISYDPYNTKAKSFAELYNILLKLTPEKFNMMSLLQLDYYTLNILMKTYCKFPLLNAGNLWNAWSKLCEVCQLYIYKNASNQTVCSYRYGA